MIVVHLSKQEDLDLDVVVQKIDYLGEQVQIDLEYRYIGIRLDCEREQMVQLTVLELLKEKVAHRDIVVSDTLTKYYVA